MSQKQKLIERFLSNPKDFTFNELESLLKYFGYDKDERGDGSRVSFYNNSTESIIKIHKPHPQNIIKTYIIKEVKAKLEECGLL